MTEGIPRPLREASAERLAKIDVLLTDMDDTLTHQGRLPPETFAAMAALRQAGIRVIPVTAAPAGWCDQMARMWPVDAVIAENGGLSFHVGEGQREPDMVFWHDTAGQASLPEKLQTVAQEIRLALPWAELAADQPFRLTSLAFRIPEAQEQLAALIALLKTSGCSTTINNLWVLAWFGGYTKLEASCRLLAEHFGLDFDSQKDRLIYSGDSLNDEPMFAALENNVGVSTVVEFLPRMRHAPTWITDAPGGYGFAELVQALLAARR